MILDMFGGALRAEGDAEEMAVFAALFLEGLREVREIKTRDESDIQKGMEELFRSIDESVRKKGDIRTDGRRQEDPGRDMR